MAEPYSDEEKLAEQIHRVYCRYYKDRHGKEYWTKGDYSKLDEATKEADRYMARFVLDTIAADRQQIENLKLDLHIANRALEIDPATVDLRIRIAELEAENQRLRDAINKALTNQIRAVAEAGSDIRDMAKDFIQTRDVKSLTNCGGDIYSLTNNAIKNLEQALHPQGEEPCGE